MSLNEITELNGVKINKKLWNLIDYSLYEGWRNFGTTYQYYNNSYMVIQNKKTGHIYKKLLSGKEKGNKKIYLSQKKFGYNKSGNMKPLSMTLEEYYETFILTHKLIK